MYFCYSIAELFVFEDPAQHVHTTMLYVTVPAKICMVCTSMHIQSNEILKLFVKSCMLNKKNSNGVMGQAINIGSISYSPSQKSLLHYPSSKSIWFSCSFKSGALQTKQVFQTYLIPQTHSSSPTVHQGYGRGEDQTAESS